MQNSDKNMIDQFKNNLTPKYWKDIKQDTFIGVEFDLTATCKIGVAHQKLLVKHFPILDEDTLSIWIKRYWEINKKPRKLVGATRFILCILADTISEGALNILSSIPFKDSTGMKNAAGYALVVDLESKKIYGKPPRIPPNLGRRCESVIACIRDTYKIYEISKSPRPGVTRKKMRSELKQWGFGLIAFGILHIILMSFLDPFWGVILIIVGIINIFVSHRAMFLLNGSAIMTAAVFNMMVIVEAEANAAFMLVIMQFVWGINEIRKFKLYDMRREMAESHPESEPDDQITAEPGLEAGASPSRGIQRGRFRRFLPVAGACLLVVILGFFGWLLRDDIRNLLFLTTKCDRIDDTVNGYARYRHVKTGAVIVDLEGTLFEALGPNEQDYPEYRHWRSDIVFVRLPGGTVAYSGRWGRSRDAPVNHTVGPYLIAKRPLIGSALESAFQGAMGRPFSAFLNEKGRYNYGTMSDFARRLGVSGWSPTVEQRLFAMGSDWKPETEPRVQRTRASAPNEYGIVGLRHDPNIEPGFRLAHDLPSSMPNDTGVVPTGLEGITSTPSRELGSAEDSKQMIRIVEQDWSGIAAGTRVYTKEGNPLKIRNDLASLTFFVSVENSSDSVLMVRPPVNLIGSGGQVVALTKLKGVRPQNRERLLNDGIEVPPGQTVILEFMSKAEEFDDLEAAEPLYVEFKLHGWRLNVELLPLRKRLYD